MEPSRSAGDLHRRPDRSRPRLEFDYVVLAAADNLMSDALLYVGASRAVTGLTVIGPSALATRLGLTP